MKHFSISTIILLFVCFVSNGIHAQSLEYREGLQMMYIYPIPQSSKAEFSFGENPPLKSEVVNFMPYTSKHGAADMVLDFELRENFEGKINQQIVFETTNNSNTEDGFYHLTGNITINGITKEITLIASLYSKRTPNNYLFIPNKDQKSLDDVVNPITDHLEKGLVRFEKGGYGAADRIFVEGKINLSEFGIESNNMAQEKDGVENVASTAELQLLLVALNGC
jgi:hypothetical protein